jgi:tripartite-type tricarboxylate transporter receptor subunit TctC
VAELVAWAKGNSLIYASGGVGVISHLSLEMFKGAARVNATHVPYKGVGPSIPDLIAGRAHVMINAIPELFPYAKGGRLRIIATLTEKRHPFMPDVPTMIEQGYPDFVLSNWVGIVAAAGTPKPAVDKLAAEVTRILKLPDVAGKLTEQGFDPGGGTPEAFGKLIRSEVARFGKAVRDSGAKAE